MVTRTLLWARGVRRIVAFGLPLFLAQLTIFPGRAAADTSPCRATAEVQPSTAVVGQQILYRVRIVRRQDVEKVDWVRGLSFPDFRAEWLPGHAEDTQMHYRGMTFVAREEDRALFAMRAGVFEIPEATLRCTIRGRGPDPPRSEIVRVAPVRVRIIDPPSEGQPEDFAGALGPLWVQTSIGAEEIHLGESLSVSILVRGSANLWNLPTPLDDDAFDAEVFWKPPSINLEAGEKLFLRRYFRLDLVPHKTGPLLIPAVRVPYYDVRTGHYEVSEAPAIHVEVLPREITANSQASQVLQSGRPTRPGSGDSTAASGAVDPTAKRNAQSTEASAHYGGWFAAAGFSLLVLAVPLGAGALRRHRHWTPTREALAEAEREREASDSRAEAAALSRALYAALELAVPELDSPSPKTLRELATSDPTSDKNRELAAAADAIDALDRARFSHNADPGYARDARDLIEALRPSFSIPWRSRAQGDTENAHPTPR